MSEAGDEGGVSTHSSVRDRQRPLRALYGEQPAEAISAKWARSGTATIAIGDAFHGEVEVGRGYGATFRYGLDRKVGGLHDLPNPGDLLCATLAACLDSTVRVVADVLAIELEDLSVEVSGEVDLRGTLLIDPDVPVGFRQMSCAVHIQPAAGTDAEAMRTLIEISEQCCVTLQSLRAGVAAEVRVFEATRS